MARTRIRLLIGVSVVLLLLDAGLNRALASQGQRLASAKAQLEVDLALLSSARAGLGRSATTLSGVDTFVRHRSADLLVIGLEQMGFEGIERCRPDELARPAEIPRAVGSLLRRATYRTLPEDLSPLAASMESVARKWVQQRDEGSYERFTNYLSEVDPKFFGKSSHGPWKTGAGNGDSEAFYIERDVVFFACLRQVGLLDESYDDPPAPK